MSITLKCNVCNIVIDEMLSYIQNKISVVDNDTIVKLCSTSFTSEEIQNSKTLLFGALSNYKSRTQRKGNGKEERDLTDILNVFRTVDSEILPVFVARQLEKLPPLTFDHLDCSKLLKDLKRLQDDVKNVKSTYATIEDLRLFKEEIKQTNCDVPVPPPRLSICNVNRRRGAWCADSGPIGLSNIHNSTLNDTAHTTTEPRLCNKTESLNDHYRSILISGRQTTEAAIDKQPLDLSAPAGAVSQRADQLFEPSAPMLNVSTSAPNNALSNVNKAMPEHEWQTVKNRKRKSYRYRGQIGIANITDCNFKAVKHKVPMFITKIHKDSDESEIVKYILRKTQETVLLEKIEMKKAVDHKAYKFFVSEEKIPMFLDKNIWPKGIVFRKFVHFRYKTTAPSLNNV